MGSMPGSGSSRLALGGIVAPSATGSGLVVAAFETHVRPEQLILEHSETIDPDESDLATERDVT